MLGVECTLALGWELVKKHMPGASCGFALVCVPSPVLASPIRILIRLLNE